MSDFDAFELEVYAGEASLITKYGRTPSINEAVIERATNDGCQRLELADGLKNCFNDHVPIATKEQTAYLEKWIRDCCRPYELFIYQMTQAELSAFICNHFLDADFERGKMPGQVPHRIYRNSEEFLSWEDSIFDKIEHRQKELEDTVRVDTCKTLKSSNE